MRRRLPIVIYRRKRIANLKNASRKLAIYLSVLTLLAVLTLYLLDYFPLGNWKSHQSALVSAVKMYVASKVSSKKHEATLAAQAILEQRTKLLLGGDAEEIKENYDLSSTTGEWAYEKAKHRATYLRKWALARGVRIVEATNTFEIDSVSEESDGSFWIELTEHTVYAYEYGPADLFQPAWLWDGWAGARIHPDRRISASSTGIMLAGWGKSHGTPGCGEIHEFGSRTVHVIEIALSDGRWKIRKDWYMDPLGDGRKRTCSASIDVTESWNPWQGGNGDMGR